MREIILLCIMALLFFSGCLLMEKVDDFIGNMADVSSAAPQNARNSLEIPEKKQEKK